MEQKTSLHKVFLITLYGALIVFVYFNLNKNSCDGPITYSVGRIDKEFGIEKEDVKNYANEASVLWNNALPNKILLKEADKNPDVVINFIFDERQRLTIQTQKLKAKIKEQKQNLTEIKTTINNLKDDYENKLSLYESKKGKYEENQRLYNEEVDSWNQKGGAPEKEYNELIKTKAKLDKEYSSLAVFLNEINSLSTKINTYSDIHNDQVKEVNAVVDEINAYVGTEFEEGIFDPNNNTITIYEYENITGLKRVLTHELGHALGIDHVTNKNSIMYYLNDSNSLELSNEDISALKTICKIK